MILALGSQFLYTRCPNPYSNFFLFFTSSMNCGMFSFFPMPCSILKTASLAPPCFGPQRAPEAPAMAVQISTPEEERCLTAAVEQFSSCSAWRMNRISKALTSLGWGLQFFSFNRSSMQRKFSTKPRFSAGSLYSRPMRCLQALAAMVGTLPMILQICLFLISLFLQMVSPTRLGFCSGWTVESAARVLQSMPMGCASYRKDFIMSSTSVWRKVCCWTFLEKWVYSLGVGSSPNKTKKATSRKDAFSARTSMGQPLYSRMPLSPSMQEIVEVQVMVFMYPGSYPLSTLPLWLIFCRSDDLMKDFPTGRSQVLPLLESVTVRESLPLMRSESN